MRLPLVASLFLALAGGPAALAEPVAAPAVVVSAASAASATVVEAAETVTRGEPAVAPVLTFAVFFLLTALVPAVPARVLTGRAGAGVAGSRAPPIAV